MSTNTLHYRVAIGIAVIACLLLVWLGLGVGIIGADGDPSNRMYLGVIVVGLVGAAISRGRPLGMARTLVAMAAVMAVILTIALVRGLGLPYSGPAELILLNGFFAAMFLASAWLFRRSGGR